MTKLNQILNDIRQSPLRWPILIAILAAFVIGIAIGGGGSDSADPHAGHNHETASTSAGTETQIWTCSMHPQIRQPKPGKCPICFMDLVPVQSSGSEDMGPRQLKLSPSAVKLAETRTAPVERQYVSSEIRMVGKVEYDETRLGYITARVPGRLDRLYVDYTGVPVKKGEHLVSMYSPELITAQQELLQAIKSARTYGSGNEIVQAAREKLKLWGLSKRQIAAIEKRGTPSDHLTIYSPISGVVIHKNAVEGLYVQTGTRIYTIADLSHLWVKLDAYESDLIWLRYGQTVEFETEAFPGETFTGKIAFIDPVLDPQTHTVHVRVNVANPRLKLKPQMFVRAVLRAKLAGSGKVMDPELAGKWISPMHPEVVKDKPGTCDVCGMPLVKAEELGYISPDSGDLNAPLVIPASAPLVTGTRAVVYLAVKDKPGVFEGKDIRLGPRAGDYYIVKKGLEEGQQVVVNGAFKLDSDLQIQAKPSMMNPQTQEKTPPATDTQSSVEITVSIDKGAVPQTFKKAFDDVAKAYFAIQHALSSDELESAKKAALGLMKTLSAIDMTQLKGKTHMAWMKLEKVIHDSGNRLTAAKDLDAARLQLETLTGAITSGVKYFGSQHTPVYLYHCPMAFDNKGAYWLQDNDDTRNPYFGPAMLKCIDSVTQIIPNKE